MSIVPTDNPFSGNLFGAPKDAFEYLLDAIIATVPSKREALVKPHLQVFTAHPVIKELISQGKAPAPTEDIPPANLELKQIQNTLSTLSKALERLSKGNPPSKNPSPSTRKKQKGRENNQQPQHTYSAVVGSRPPNPSLVVDLAHMDFPDGSRPRPEHICKVLNRKLGEVMPPQAQVAAARWTAKGNLVITAGPSSSSVSLLSAAPHINAILSTTLKLPSHSPFAQPMSQAKLATSQNTRNPGVTNLAPKQSYSQAVQTRKPTRDPVKQAHDCGKMSHDSSRDPPVSSASHDPSRDHTRSHDPTCFGRVSHPLINTWQTVGTNQRINERVGIPPMKRNPQRDFPLALKRIEPVRSNAQYCAAAIGTPPYS